MLNRKKVLILSFCALAGTGYFAAFSQLDIVPFLKGNVALLPVQLGVLVYVLYLRWSGRSPNQLSPEPSRED